MVGQDQSEDQDEQSDESDDESYQQMWDDTNISSAKPAPVVMRKYTPDEFTFLKVLGKGSFGKVCELLHFETLHFISSMCCL